MWKIIGKFFQRHCPGGFDPPRVWTPSPNLLEDLGTRGPYPLVDLVPPPYVFIPKCELMRQFTFISRSTPEIRK